jgi:hypothetical protein
MKNWDAVDLDLNTTAIQLKLADVNWARVFIPQEIHFFSQNEGKNYDFLMTHYRGGFIIVSVLLLL